MASSEDVIVLDSDPEEREWSREQPDILRDPQRSTWCVCNFVTISSARVCVGIYKKNI